MAWTLKFKDKEQSFSDWGFSHLHRRTRNLQADIVTFVQEDVNFDDDPEFAFDDEITIKRDGKQWFVGRIRSSKLSGAAEAEQIVYEAHGALSWLDDLIFRQPWRYLFDKNDPKSEKQTFFSADLVLFQKIPGDVSSLMTVKEQVQEIFQYLQDRWTAFSIPTKFQLDDSRIATHQAPFTEVSMISCAMALEMALKTVPDCAIWSDYNPAEDSSDTSIPRIRIARRGTAAQAQANPDNYLKAVTLTIPDEGEGNDSPIIKVDIEPRSELKSTVVDIEYQLTNSVNGFSTRFVVEDVYPPGSDITGFRVLPQVVHLEGTNITYPQAVLSTRSIDKDSADWWKLHHTALAKSNVQNLVIREATRGGTLPFEIIPNSDAWAPWMAGNAEEDTIQCYADYDVTDKKTDNNGVTTDVVTSRERNKLLTVRVMSTDLTSGTYFGAAQGTLGEPVPTGMAQALWEATSELHYDGTIVLDEDECSGSVQVGNVVNIISSKRPEWATARAMVQEISEDIDAGQTTITVGPPKFLGVNEIMDWLRGLRASSQGWWNSRVSGLAQGTGALRVAARAHKDTLSASLETKERILLMRPDSQTQTSDTLTAQILLDILHCLGKPVQINEWQICIDGTKFYSMILSSALYRTPRTANPIGSAGSLPSA